MKTIGFTEVYYTLWDVGPVYEEPVIYNGMRVGTNYKQDVVYCKNLAMDLERAKAKMEGEYNIDLDLKGHSSFSRITGSSIKNREDYYPHDCFSFGRMEGSSFSTATDTWQLFRAYHEEKSPRRRALARRRLVELGALVRFDHVDRDGKKIKYLTPGAIADIKEQQKNGHWFNNGEKVELEVKELKRFGFSGAFGYTTIVVYETKCNKIVKYMGGSPINLMDKAEDSLRKELEKVRRTEAEHGSELCKQLDEKQDELEKKLKELVRPEWYKISATVKHDSYRGPETKLLRIKNIK